VQTRGRTAGWFRSAKRGEAGEEVSEVGPSYAHTGNRRCGSSREPSTRDLKKETRRLKGGATRFREEKNRDDNQSPQRATQRMNGSRSNSICARRLKDLDPEWMAQLDPGAAGWAIAIQHNLQILADRDFEQAAALRRAAIERRQARVAASLKTLRRRPLKTASLPRPRHRSPRKSSRSSRAAPPGANAGGDPDPSAGNSVGFISNSTTHGHRRRPAAGAGLRSVGAKDRAG
jgi:hypothetical protein